MKTVLSNGEIPHLWAHRVQPHARNAKGTFYFDGDTIYSYGRHFPIACHVENRAGEHAILFTTNNRSVATSGHKNEVRSSIPPHVPVFNVPRVGAGSDPNALRLNIESYHEEISRLLLKASRATKNRYYYHDQAIKIFEEMQRYAAFFGLNAGDVQMPCVDKEAMVEWRKQAEAAAWEAEKERLAKLLEEEKENIFAWRTGSYWGHFPNIPIMLRVRDGQVETSRGAEVPLSDAVQAIPLILSCKESGTVYSRTNGDLMPYRLGHFLVDQIDPDGTLHAGCHTIKFDEIERIIPAVRAAWGEISARQDTTTTEAAS